MRFSLIRNSIITKLSKSFGKWSENTFKSSLTSKISKVSQFWISFKTIIMQIVELIKYLKLQKTENSNMDWLIESTQLLKNATLWIKKMLGTLFWKLLRPNKKENSLKMTLTKVSDFRDNTKIHEIKGKNYLIFYLVCTEALINEFNIDEYPLL